MLGLTRSSIVMEQSAKIRILIPVMVFFGLFFPVAGVMAFEEVAGSRHDFFGRGMSGSDLSTCDACHLEPGGPASTPLWDPSKKGGQFPVDYPPTSRQREKPSLETKPIGPSFKCLSCHDGVLGNEVHRGGAFISGRKGSNGAEASEKAVRSPDHPDSVVYPRSSAGRLVSQSNEPKLKNYWSVPDKRGDSVVIPTGPTSAALGLQSISPDDIVGSSRLVRTYEGMIHCDSCHNPHNNENRPFLRLPHKTLCLACHDR